jgi:hypothetical protein
VANVEGCVGVARERELATSGETAIDEGERAPPKPAPPAGASGRTRAVLRWFGIDPTGLDPTTPCAVCGLPAVIGGDRCPAHLETRLEEAKVLPGMRLGGVLTVAATLALLGAVLGFVASDDRFAWIGAAAAASQVVAGIARQLRFGRLATAMGMVAFFTALTLILAGLLVAAIAALPWIVQRLL